LWVTLKPLSFKLLLRLEPVLQRELGRLMATALGMEIAWVPLPDDSPLTGLSLAESNTRAKTEASVIAVLRDRRVLPNPKSALIFQAGDVVG
jgi:TrkA domain protein